MSALDRAFMLFFALWVVWGLGTYLALYRRRPAAFRRAWHARVAVASSAMFLTFLLYAASIGLPRENLFLFVPAVLALTFVNVRNTRFCDACGKQTFALKRPARCPRCGAPV